MSFLLDLLKINNWDSKLIMTINYCNILGVKPTHKYKSKWVTLKQTTKLK